ncbi:hypothetical protein [Paenimyroides aestuarii]|uniref:NADH dehydrogenase subunit 6 n=1 Tax=Paenimyroides aestuarii TaxID=2968490 RepID=A0ABY5NUZ9_9FLAO|nr:hypothetical protein [Paenimyroides aestuarii]UUV22303.1 hypothetical protein NPX36_04510 [Paenimyroides aestuarii]
MKTKPKVKSSLLTTLFVVAVFLITNTISGGINSFYYTLFIIFFTPIIFGGFLFLGFILQFILSKNRIIKSFWVYSLASFLFIYIIIFLTLPTSEGDFPHQLVFIFVITTSFFYAICALYLEKDE